METPFRQCFIGVKEMIPFLIATMIMVLALVFMPNVIMFLPNLVF